MKREISRIIYLFFFLCMVLVPLVFTNTGTNVKSDLDNRVLTEMPKLGDPSFNTQIEKYLQDRIGFRSQMVTWYQILNDRLTGYLAHPIYTYGQNGYIFFKMHNNITYGDFHKTFAEAVKKMQDYCESRGSKFYFLFDPEKISVYRQYLPVGVNYNDDWVDEMLAYMNELGVKRVINNTATLKEKSQTERVFNKQYDAGHWNDLGCFYGTNNLWNAIHEDFPMVTGYAKDEFVIDTTVGQYLANSKFPVNEKIPSFLLRVPYDVKTEEYNGIQLDSRYGAFCYFVNQGEAANEYPKAMIFQGSYYNRAPQFFVGRTREYIGIHDYQNVLNLDYYFNIFQPEIVVFEVAEYTFSDTYFDSEKMGTLDYNRGLVIEGNSVKKSILRAKEGAKRVDSNIDICIEAGTGFDTVYFDTAFSNAIPNAKYVYIFTGNNIYDMIRNEDGTYRTDVPHNGVGKIVDVYYVDTDGGQFYFDAFVKRSEDLVKNIRYQEGASFDEESSQYIFKTDVEDNRFNVIELQLLDDTAGEYIGPIASTSEIGLLEGVYTHKEETGLYTIRLKGNTNRKDVGIEFSAYLEKEKIYTYKVNLISLEEKEVVLSDYSFIGSHVSEATNMITDIQYSEGVSLGESSVYTMRTVVEGNKFNSAVLNLTNANTNKLSVGVISQEREPGLHHGYYVHNDSTGDYLFKLRGNTNIHDEYIGALVYMEKGKIYEWQYEIDWLDSEEVKVSKLSIRKID